MARKVFYSFHYQNDYWRTGTIRGIGKLDPVVPLSDNDWESVKGGGDSAIKRWIDGQLDGTSCVIVLVGQDTANRKYVEYEIEKGWSLNKGIVGIRIHQLKDSKGDQGIKGPNPFQAFRIGQRSLADIVKCHEAPYSASEATYGYIRDNIESWVEEAIRIRAGE